MRKALIHKGFSICGKIGTTLNNVNPYTKLAQCYGALGEYDKAKEALDLMYKYTKQDIIRRDYYNHMSMLYRNAMDFDEAYKYAVLAEENNADFSFTYKTVCLMALRRYEEAYELFWDFALNDTEPDCDVLLNALHCKYLMDGTLEEEYLYEIKDMVEEKMKTLDGQIGCNYFHLSDIYHHLGDHEKKTYYRKLGMDYSWENAIDRNTYIQIYDMWDYWYAKDYEGAYNYYRSVDYMDGNIELDYLMCYLREMFEKDINKN